MHARMQLTACALQEADGVDGEHDKRPPTTKLGHGHGSCRATARCRAIGKDTVDDKRVGAIDPGNGDEALVQPIVAAVSDQAVVVRSVVVVVASTHGVALAVAVDGERGVGAIVVRIRLVAEAVRVVVMVSISTIRAGCQPNCRQEGEGGDGEEERVDTARRGATSAVGNGRAAAVVGTTPVCGPCA